VPTISEADLLRFAQDLLQTGGIAAANAAVVADSLVQANLRGHDSHGVMRIPFYVAKVKDGSVNPAAGLTLEKESGAVIVGDGGWGLGQVLVRDLMSRLIAKAKNTGIACGTLKRAAHIGRLGEYAEIAAKQGMASMICANTHGAAQRVAPVGAKRPRLGTNPLCLGMPGGEQGPFVFDIGTSATAEGKVRVKKIAGMPVPLGWILDADGKPTTDPNQLYGDPPGSILPMGGDQAYKGFGLAYMIEIMSGGFSGGSCALPNGPAPVGNCAFFVVWNPEFFGGGAEHLLKEVGRLEQYVRDVPLIEGVDAIQLPGDPERKTLAQRQANGIPLDDGNWKALVDMAKQQNVTIPAVK
jgi:uncharacterized oxidoreductase